MNNIIKILLRISFLIIFPAFIFASLVLCIPAFIFFPDKYAEFLDYADNKITKVMEKLWW